MSQPNENPEERPRLPKRRRTSQSTDANAAGASTSAESSNSTTSSRPNVCVVHPFIITFLDGETESVNASSQMPPNFDELPVPEPSPASARYQPHIPLLEEPQPIVEPDPSRFRELYPSLYNPQPYFGTPYSYGNLFDNSYIEPYCHHQERDNNRFPCPLDNLRRRQDAQFQLNLHGGGQPPMGCRARHAPRSPVQQAAITLSDDENDNHVEVVASTTPERSPVISPILPIIVLQDADTEAVVLEHRDTQTDAADLPNIEQREVTETIDLVSEEDQSLEIFSTEGQTINSSEIEENFGNIIPLNLSEESDTE
ncbi:hypothetical protein ILUMI_27282 [Ignelater luminosus]|uniref:Uncharacterized protein n=1 Tax=Ignelater luminosus TaxID=2038154 RepID=A0A8K0C5C2_IGNLU|nr:hypothetical protein ILUMI_27282 [Ignelater luminosus]